MGFIFFCYIRALAHVIHLSADKAIMSMLIDEVESFLKDEKEFNFKLLIIGNRNQIFTEIMTQTIFMISTCDYKNYSSNFELRPRCLKLLL